MYKIKIYNSILLKIKCQYQMSGLKIKNNNKIHRYSKMHYMEYYPHNFLIFNGIQKIKILKVSLLQ